nr:ParB/RepB/Spo0J family partition protein [Acutalibacter muris]
MAISSAANLLSVDSLFTTQAQRDEEKRESVRDIPLSDISDFPNHPFKVRMDESMTEMADSVRQYGVLVPGLVRPKPEGGYEMVAGHRRKKVSELAGLETVPCIVRELTDDEATIIMVDSNLQREQILPSEKAFAYKMKLDAMRRQAGRPSKENCDPVGHNLIGIRSVELLADNTPDSKTVFFIFNADNITKETEVVAFESICRDGVESAVHADINDQGQTVKLIPTVPDTPKTGDDSHPLLWKVLAVLAALGMAACCGGFIASVMAKRKKEGAE